MFVIRVILAPRRSRFMQRLMISVSLISQRTVVNDNIILQPSPPHSITHHHRSYVGVTPCQTTFHLGRLGWAGTARLHYCYILSGQFLSILQHYNFLDHRLGIVKNSSNKAFIEWGPHLFKLIIYTGHLLRSNSYALVIFFKQQFSSLHL